MDHVVGWLFLGFWVVLGAAMVVRLVLALRRRRGGSSLGDSVLRPVVSAGTAGVWPALDTRASEKARDQRPAQARDQRPDQSPE